jgi:hypothetical protein
MSSGFVIPSSLLDALDSYMTAATCLNQSANIFLQPSPFGAIELIKLTLKYSKIPVDILVLGTMTNIATAISEDRSIISKIGTLYFSGGKTFIFEIILYIKIVKYYLSLKVANSNQ